MKAITNEWILVQNFIELSTKIKKNNNINENELNKPKFEPQSFG